MSYAAAANPAFAAAAAANPAFAMQQQQQALQQQQETFQRQRVLQARKGMSYYVYRPGQKSWYLVDSNGNAFGGYANEHVRPAIKANNGDLYGFTSAKEVDEFFNDLTDTRKNDVNSLMAEYRNFMIINNTSASAMLTQMAVPL